MVRTEQCTQQEEQLVANQRNTVLRKIAPENPDQQLWNHLLTVPGIDRVTRQYRIPQRLRKRIIKMMYDTSELVVDCRPEAQCQFLRGQYLPSEREIEMCRLKQGEPALFFHELVHAARGNEFDAEVYENLVFDSQDGATEPTPSDITKFEESDFSGKYAYLDQDENTVYNSQREVLNIDPSLFTRNQGLF